MIIVMDNGQISEVGSFTELINHKGPFAEFLDNYMINKANDSTDAVSGETNSDSHEEEPKKKLSSEDHKSMQSSDPVDDETENTKKVHAVFCQIVILYSVYMHLLVFRQAHQ